MEDEKLAFYIYPLPQGTSYTRNKLMDAISVEILFDYCQILEGVILKKGWDFLIEFYGYQKLYDINKKSGWFDCENMEEFVLCIEENIKDSI